MRRIKLGSKLIDDASEPYIIAEIGVNHEGSMSLAKRLIEMAHEGGADAAKFQSYKAETLASKTSPSYWDLTKEKTTSQYELFKKYDTFNKENYRELKEHCDKVGIDFISTPFDLEAIDYLAEIAPFLKVASADLTNTPFLRAAAKTKKSVVLSTGASTLSEIKAAVKTLIDSGCSGVALLHCVLNYPTPDEFANISMIDDLVINFPDLIIGYSDHTVPDSQMLALNISYIKGARIIEKHFTHDKTLPGNDHYHAMDVNDLKKFRSNIKEIRPFLGSNKKNALTSEASARSNARRSLVTKGKIAKGMQFTEKNLTFKRPGFGISPLHWDELIGTTASCDLDDDHILQWSDILEHALKSAE